MRRFEKIPWKERKTQKSENPEISSVWEEIQDLNGDIKRWLKYYSFATAISWKILKKPVKSIDLQSKWALTTPLLHHFFSKSLEWQNCKWRNLAAASFEWIAAANVITSKSRNIDWIKEKNAMKKVIYLFVLCMVLGLAGCGQSQENKEPASENASVQTEDKNASDTVSNEHLTNNDPANFQCQKKAIIVMIMMKF